jgi:hypothetical protein
MASGLVSYSRFCTRAMSMCSKASFNTPGYELTPNEVRFKTFLQIFPAPFHDSKMLAQRAALLFGLGNRAQQLRLEFELEPVEHVAHCIALYLNSLPVIQQSLSSSHSSVQLAGAESTPLIGRLPSGKVVGAAGLSDGVLGSEACIAKLSALDFIHITHIQQWLLASALEYVVPATRKSRISSAQLSFVRSLACLRVFVLAIRSTYR